MEKKNIPSVQFSKDFNDFDFTLVRRHALTNDNFKFTLILSFCI